MRYCDRLLYTRIVIIYELDADLSINKVVPVSNVVKQEIHTHLTAENFLRIFRVSLI